MSRLGPVLRRKTFAGFVVVRRGLGNPKRPISNPRALQAALAYAEAPRGWLVIAEGNVAGQTHLAAAISNYRLKHGKDGLFVVAPDLLDHLRAYYAPDSAVSYDERF